MRLFRCRWPDDSPEMHALAAYERRGDVIPPERRAHVEEESYWRLVQLERDIAAAQVAPPRVALTLAEAQRLGFA